MHVDEKVKCKLNRVDAHCHFLCSNRINIYIEKKKDNTEAEWNMEKEQEEEKVWRSDSNLMSKFALNSVWTGNLIKLGVDEMSTEWLLVIGFISHII